MGTAVMIGHQQILTARRRRQKPGMVFVLVGGPPPAHPEGDIARRDYPEVHVAPGEVADWSFLVGLNVIVEAYVLTDAIVAQCDAIVACAPAMLIAIGTDQGEVIQYKHGEWQAWGI